MKVKELKIQLWPIGDITPYELNAKKHEPEQIAKIVKAIQLSGWDVPIVVDKHGVIIKGHGRRLAAIELELQKVPVIVRDDLTPEQVRAARLADNRAAISDIDPEKLREELSSLDYDLGGIFDSKELEFLDADLGKVNLDAFVNDMDATVADQKADLDGRISSAEAARVKVHKAFGFPDVPSGGQLVITQFMALAEAHTQKQGGDALIQFLKDKFVEVA